MSGAHRPAGAPSSVVDVSSVSKVFGGRGKSAETIALDGVSFSSPPGSLTCLVGPSGCGKTTLLNLIAGFVEPSAGEVRVRGDLVRSPGPERAVVFQDYALLPWFRVRRNVELGLELQGLPADEIRTRTDRNLELVGLREAGQKYPHQLSGGMQQRVSIARALALEPSVLLMDEPFGGLDAYTRMDLQTELIEIWKETRVSILFVTHSVDEAVFLGTDVLVMAANPGRIIDSIDVEIPRPRDRTSPEFNAVKRRVLGHLSKGSNGNGNEPRATGESGIA